MSNQELIEYIKKQIQENKGIEEIKKELLDNGWQENIIQETLKILNISSESKPPVPPSSSNYKETGLQNLDPKAVWVFFLRYIGPAMAILIWFGFNIVLGLMRWEFLVLISLIIIVLTFIWAKLTYKFYHYELTEDGFRKELGVIVKKYTSIPYERIQNINIQRGVLDRIMGLSSLKIFTAGTGGSGIGGAEGLLPCLSQETAEQLRDELIHRSRTAKSNF